MRKQRVFCLILVMIVLLAFLAAVYLTFRPGVTIIITGKNNGAYHTLQNDQKVGHKNSTASKEDGSFPKDGGRKEEQQEESLLSGVSSEILEDTLPPVSVPVITPDNSASTNDSSTVETDPDDSQISKPQEDEKPPAVQDFSEAEEYADRIAKNYEMTVTLNTADDPVDSDTAFQNAELAALTAQRLENYLGRFDRKIFSGLSRRGYHINMVLSHHVSNQITAEVQGKSISYRIGAGQGSWEYLFLEKTVGILETVMSVQTDMAALHEEFVQYNPKGFRYGVPNYDYIQTIPEHTYFYTVEQQASVSKDRIELYVLYVIGGIPSEYLQPECPLSHKLSVLKSQIKTYIE